MIDEKRFIGGNRFFRNDFFACVVILIVFFGDIRDSNELNIFNF